MDPLPPEVPRFSEMEAIIDEHSLTTWDWNDFLDFNLDDQLNISIVSDNLLPEAEREQPEEVPVNGEVGSPEVPCRSRKRDPRLTCSNFLAGRIPCACPEIDEKLEEEEAGLPGKKRSRTVRSSYGSARCQVPGCEADIRELKGYHRRHRVCLRCANASVVVLDGQRKRYCQQCGKFHVLSDFDEGKRSCRRKLERHNNRRRRKPTDSRSVGERGSQGTGSAEDVACDDENGKDNICLSGQVSEKEPLLESEEGHISTLCLDPVSNNVQSDTVASFVASGETKTVGEKDESKCVHSPSYCDTKSAYSSVCPTGRISFKLYDWNPAEFPRRLRHQIFQWLASMPVELEGYIRPGCTILTMFISMPKLMWLKTLQDPLLYLCGLIAAPRSMLCGRDSMLVYLDDMIFRIMKDGISVMQIKGEKLAPKLHYIHPTCFEAGQPMDFVACGSNLLQPKFRFLVSFAGKYLAHEYHIPPYYGCTREISTSGFDHQVLRIHIPHTEPNIFGPAFIEVENESGLSNFIPILIGSKEICSEMKKMEQIFEASERLKGSKLLATSCSSDSCEVSALRQSTFSQFLVDAAWLLREPLLQDTGQILASSQIGRFNGLLSFLINNEATCILERVLCNIQKLLDTVKLNVMGSAIADTDMRLLQSNIDIARQILCQRLHKYVDLIQHSQNHLPEGDYACEDSRFDTFSATSFTDQGVDPTDRSDMDASVGSNIHDRSGTTPLLNKEVVMSINFVKERHGKSCSRILTNSHFTSRPFIFLLAATVVCLGICAVVLHPQKVGKITVTIRRCLFDNS